ncbi:glycosyltransferase [Roseateles sp. BYS87W]|uniref:Glycosyltransferase n=1 Tax=Pelomonas baiyunensis TaxID=3299026 RepID=A0ABW7H3W7_9BURK
MKILLFTLDGWPTFRPDVTALWGEFLPAQGVHSDLCTLGTQAEVPPWPAGQSWVCPPGGGKVKELLRSFVHDLRTLWQQRKGNHTAVVVRDKTFIALPALWWARWTGRPFYYWMSFPMAESLVRLQGRLSVRREPARWLYLGWRGHVGGWLLHRCVLPKAHHVFVQSRRMAQDLAATGLPMDRMTPVPMCISPARFAQPLPRQPHPAGRRVLGYLGECSRVRRPDFLLEALAIVRERVPEVLLLVVGDALEPAEQQWLRAEVARLGLQAHVHITGWLPPEQVAPLFAQVEVALALMAPDPLLDSTTPTKLVEYLAMQRPVVANDHPDQSDVLAQSGGGLCTPFEPRAYAQAIERLLAEPERAAAMAAAGRAWVLGHRSYDRCAEQLATELRRLHG